MLFHYNVFLSEDTISLADKDYSQLKPFEQLHYRLFTVFEGFSLFCCETSIFITMLYIIFLGLYLYSKDK